MTSVNSICKKTMCFMLVLVLILSSMSLTVFAANDTKTVTYSRMYTFVVSPAQFPNYANSPSSYVSSTYYYNDGTYKGTLNLINAVCWSPIQTGDPVGSQLQVRINAEYSGTVSATVETKTVSCDRMYTFVVSPSQFPNYANSPSSYVASTYYYNDGTYKGTLKLINATCWSPIATGNPVGSQLQVRINASYSGTVTKK